MGIFNIWKKKKQEKNKESNLQISKEDGTDNDNMEMDYKKELPKGVGYKSGWLVIEGSNQKTIADTIFGGGYEKMTFQNGVACMEQKTMIAPDYQGKNFVMGSGVETILYELETLQEQFKAFPKVYGYVTHRVSEAHGFCLMEYGKITRLYRQDDEELISVGEPLPIERKLGICLPHDMDEMWDLWEDDSVTKMDEEVIMQLALSQVGVDSSQYPYEDVLIGTMK